MTEDLKKTKKRVFEEWKNAFPQLSVISQNKLYKTIGPIIIGLELIKLPRVEEYRPHFVMYSLWGNKMGTNLDACLAGPIMVKEYTNNKGFQFSIPYIKHSIFFAEALECIKKQTPLLFDTDISLEKLFCVLNEYAMTKPLSSSPNSYLQAALQEVKFNIGLYYSVIEAKVVLDEIKKRDWDTNHFKMCGVALDVWLRLIEKKLDNRESLLKIIETNKVDKKLNPLSNSDIMT